MEYNPNQVLVSEVENSTVATSSNGDSYSQIKSLTGTFSKWTNGNSVEDSDSFAPAPARLYVPTGYFVKVTSTLTVDDWGKITIIPVDSIMDVDDITALNMTSEVATPGVRGGHVRWTKTSTVLLPAGLYDIYVRHDNAVYTGEYADKGASNLSFCEVSMTFAYDTVPSLKCPLLINAVFSQCQTETDERTALELAQEPTSYSASGFIYRGYIDVYYSDGTTKRIPAQTGGWVAMESPFKVTKDRTSFDPYLWPDTACPTCLKAPAKKDYPGIDKEASGNTNGYTIHIDEDASKAQIEGAESGRTYIKLHLAKRIGSEGCISTMEWYGNENIARENRANRENNPLWFELVDAMKNANTKLRNPIPITIRYVGAQPDYNRIPADASYYQNVDLRGNKN